ncbi:MAG: DUF6438 domain-containing protein [Bacteroidia bacterium]|nr:DUF6438 domain-containing protein [Bacteroidia bacterium]
MTSYGQLDKFKGTWISSSRDVMVINDTLNKYCNSNMLCTADKDEGMAFFLLGDTLSFQTRYYSSETNYKKLYVERYDLIVLKQTDTSLTVRPSSNLSKEFFNKRTNLTFIEQKFNKDRSISFEKIIYHTTSCFGSCPTIEIEIDNNRNVYLKGEFYKGDSMDEIDIIKSGQFFGKLNDTLYKELINILQTCNLKTLTFPEKEGADAPVTTLIIYYNGQRKYLKSMFPPTIASKLIEFLYLVNERTDLTRTNEKRIIEK